DAAIGDLEVVRVERDVAVLEHLETIEYVDDPVVLVAVGIDDHQGPAGQYRGAAAPGVRRVGGVHRQAAEGVGGVASAAAGGGDDAGHVGEATEEVQRTALGVGEGAAGVDRGPVERHLAVHGGAGTCPIEIGRLDAGGGTGGDAGNGAGAGAGVHRCAVQA